MNSGNKKLMRVLNGKGAFLDYSTPLNVIFSYLFKPLLKKIYSHN